MQIIAQNFTFFHFFVRKRNKKYHQCLEDILTADRMDIYRMVSIIITRSNDQICDKKMLIRCHNDSNMVSHVNMCRLPIVYN